MIVDSYERRHFDPRRRQMLRSQHRVAIYKDIMLEKNVIARGDLWLDWVKKYVYPSMGCRRFC